MENDSVKLKMDKCQKIFFYFNKFYIFNCHF